MTELTPRQLAALKSIVDGLLPPIKAPNGSKDVTYWEHQLSKDEDFMEAITNIVVLNKLAPTQKLLLLGLLTALTTLPGTILLVGSIQCSAFVDWSLQERTDGLLRMQHSTLPQRRQAFQSLKRLVCHVAFTYQRKREGTNPFWSAMGYPGPPRAEECPPKDLLPTTDVPLIWQPNFEKKSTKDGHYVLECDICVVGSGAGGGVAAHVLAKAGYKVIVLEKGPYIPPESLSGLEGEAIDKLYDGHGLISSANGNISILAGSTLGGGTAVNWSCCLPTPMFVREEWVNEHKLSQFAANGDFDESMRVVYEAMNVTTDPAAIQHNVNNQKLQEGCEILGFNWKTTGQNVDTTQHKKCCGLIPFGDRFGLKRDGRVAFLHPAVQHGARILDNCQALRILTSRRRTGNKRATGVLCKQHNNLIRVEAKRGVILAAGSIHSPYLLMKSGLRNKHIGQHLRLHPATAISGRMPEHVNSFEGAPMTTVATEFEQGPCRDGYGAKIEGPSIHPGIAAVAGQVESPAVFKQHLLTFNRASSFLVLQRDRSEGRVSVGFDGFPVVSYTLNDKDKASMICASQGALKILLAAGAEEVGTFHRQDRGFKSALRLELRTKSQIETSYMEELEAIKKRGIDPCDMCLFSAHQMGTCRMSSSSSTGVVDCNGETWECDDLFVVDASLFPTPTGVNPMMSILATSHMLSKRLTVRLSREDSGAVGTGVRRRSLKPVRLSGIWEYALSLPFLSDERWRFLIQASAPTVALCWLWFMNKPVLKSG